MSIDPPPVLPPPKFVSTVLELMECVCTHVVSDGAGPVCWCGIYPGSAVSWEYCGSCENDVCGMAWVRPSQAYPYDTFPFPTLDPNCKKPLALGIEVGVIRCVPVMEEDGSLPDAESMTVAGIGQILDMIALYRAISCCTVDLTVQEWTPVSGGGCAGGFWTVFLDTNLA